MQTLIINKGRVLQNVIMFMLTGVLLTLGGCLDDKEDLIKKEEEAIKEYIEKNDITVQSTESGLYYIETETGTGLQPQQGDTVYVHYTGKLIDGTVFDTSEGGNPFSFELGVGYVIQGWDEGIAYMKEGGKATLIIPSQLGYGSTGATSIPPYSTLIFDVELVDVR
ncbi:MAG: FKBP-type peptidyl-prolyl cis-trans isomerase [Bacteroidetes bacterium]|nr:FKBP-type peptidyl-prolyl cis-trans isomerase [Bacteroidota bacterium]